MKLQLKKKKLPGCLITFCGLDGSGKSTMIKYLYNELASKQTKVVLTKQPTKAVRDSEIFRNYMDCEVHEGFAYRSLSLLAASDRLQHSECIIEPLLKEGTNVISDRYFYSCLANLRARGFEDDRWIYEIAENIIEPDVSFFIDVPVEVAVKRVRERPDEKDKYIDMQLQYRLRQEYLTIAENVGGVLISGVEPLEWCRERMFQEIYDRGII